MESTIATTGAVPALPRYASWGSRVWASTLDAIFNVLLLIPVGIIFSLVRSDLANWAGLVLSLVYFTLGHGGATGQTWGKRVAGIRVVHESGAPLGYVRALMRWAVAIGLTILFLLPNLIDVLWPLWDSKKQALRDKAVGSIVIRA